MWLVARNRYFQYYALGEVGILVEVGGLSIQYLDGGKRGMLGKNEPWFMLFYTAFKHKNEGRSIMICNDDRNTCSINYLKNVNNLKSNLNTYNIICKTL